MHEKCIQSSIDMAQSHGECCHLQFGLKVQKYVCKVARVMYSACDPCSQHDIHCCCQYKFVSTVQYRQSVIVAFALDIPSLTSNVRRTMKGWMLY